MNKVLVHAVSLSLSVVFSAAADAAKPLRVLAIGNSYTQSLLPEFPKVAKAAGCSLDLAVFAIGGKSLSNHWANCEAALKDPSYRPYDVGGRKTNLPEILSEKTWDVVTLQEQSAAGMYPESFDPWADRIVAFVRERLPKARICLQLTWSDTVASHRITADGVKGSLGLTQDEMYAALEKTYVSQARRLGATIIPVGKAVQIYRKELPVRLVKPTKEDPNRLFGIVDFPGAKSGEWFGFRFKARGEVQSIVRWGEKGLKCRPMGASICPSATPMGDPDADGWRVAIGVVRIPNERQSPIVVLKVNRTEDKGSDIRDFALYRLMSHWD